MVIRNFKEKSPCFVLFAVTLAWAGYLFVSFNPGAMSTDSLYIMQQARDGVFKDDHPPLMAMTWWLLAKTSSSQEVMLAFNLALFWLGSFLVFAALSIRNKWFVFIGFSIFAMQPALLGILGVIWIDIFMAGLLMMTVGTLAIGATTTGRVKIAFILASMLFGFLAVGARHNSVAAVSPLFAVALVFLISSDRLKVKRLAALSIVALMVALLSLISWGQISKHVTLRPNNMVSLLAMYDLAGTASQVGHDIPQLSSLNPVKFSDVVLLYTPRSVIPLQVGEQVHSVAPVSTSGVAIPMRDSLGAEGKQALMKNWISAIRDYPLAYLAHRANVFASLIGLPPWTELWSPLYSAVLENDIGIKAKAESEESEFQRLLRSLSHSTYLFYPAIYLLISAFALPFTLTVSMRQNDRMMLLASAILLSGIAHMTGLFFTAASADFRYSHWMIVSTCLGVSITMVRLICTLFQRSKLTGADLRSIFPLVFRRVS